MLRLQPNPIERTGDDTPARSLLRYVWRMSGYHQVGICLLALTVAGLSMAPLELQRRIINGAIEQSNLDLLFWLGCLYLAVLLLQALLKFLLRVYQGWLSESAVRYGRAHLGRLHGTRDNRGRSDSEGEGRAVSVITGEMDKLGGFVGEGLSQPVVNLGMLFAIVGYMLYVDPMVAAFSFAFLLPQLVIVPLVQRLLNRLIEKRLSLIRDLSDSITDARDAALANAESEGRDEQAGAGDKAGCAPDRGEKGAFSAQLDAIFRNRMRIFITKFALKGTVNLLNGLAPITVLVVGGYLVLKGETTLGVVVAFMTGFERLANPLRELLAYYRIAAQSNVQHKMIAEWM